MNVVNLPRIDLTGRQYIELPDAASERKSLWISEVRAWGEVDGYTIPEVAAVTWYQDGSPWTVLDVEEISVNVDVGEYVRSSGP